jgi:NAD(P)-dependent dehydrogenase (short-subunit alcohol dehydrogenase family)
LPRPEDVGWAAVYLASPEAEVVTGITLRIDGGSTAARGLVLG